MMFQSSKKGNVNKKTRENAEKFLGNCDPNLFTTSINNKKDLKVLVAFAGDFPTIAVTIKKAIENANPERITIDLVDPIEPNEKETKIKKLKNDLKKDNISITIKYHVKTIQKYHSENKELKYDMIILENPEILTHMNPAKEVYNYFANDGGPRVGILTTLYFAQKNTLLISTHPMPLELLRTRELCSNVVPEMRVPSNKSSAMFWNTKNLTNSINIVNSKSSEGFIFTFKSAVNIKKLETAIRESRIDNVTRGAGSLILPASPFVLPTKIAFTAFNHFASEESQYKKLRLAMVGICFLLLLYTYTTLLYNNFSPSTPNPGF